MSHRIEKDSLGEFKVPNDRLYGAQTARAVENFPISGIGIGREMISALGMIKSAAAEVNLELGNLSSEISAAIVNAANEVAEGKLDDHFPVDVYQTGSGTSSNMNANEVISNRAIQLLGGEVGSKSPVHPNDHVNFGQSSNDVFPTAIHLAAAMSIKQQLLPNLELCERSLLNKAKDFDGVVKIGRTHLQDATPIRLGQEFSGYAFQIKHTASRLRESLESIYSLAQGGTAVGTGLNTHPEFGKRMATKLSKRSGLPFKETENHFAAQGCQDGAVQVSGALKGVAVALMKIANDIRWLGSGPKLGLGEIEIPAVQPGSSIMPGKVNPVLAEAAIMVAAQVIGNDAVVTTGAIKGNFELNTMLPVIARNLLESVQILSNTAKVFSEKLIDGLKANESRISSLNEKSLSLATALAPHIGYDQAAKIAKESFKSGRTVREIAKAEKVLPADQLDKVLDLLAQTKPGVPKKN